MSSNGDPSAFYGKRIIEEHHAFLLKQLPKVTFDRNLPDPLEISDDDHRFLAELKVGILGAGVGGLYTALILDSLGIEYEILEASDRVGGRLSTYRFPDKGQYDYFDEGAMRFPLPEKEDGKYKNGTMKRLAELIEYGPLNREDPLKNKLIPYYPSSHNRPGFYYFNGIFQPVGGRKESFEADKMGVSAAYIAAGSDAIENDVINPFVRILANDLETGSKDGWAVLMENDAYSVRGYMASKYLPSNSLNLPPQHLSNDVINWCNLLESSSGGYDRALTASVLSAFKYAKVGNIDYSAVEWKCFEGGSETLSNKMVEYINSTGVVVNFGQRVTAIGQGNMVVSIPSSYELPPSVKETLSDSVEVVIEEAQNDKSRRIVEVPCVTVTVNGSETKQYSHVVSTLPLPVLRTVDLNNAGLNIMQKNALRALDYGPSIKIAILFKSVWWTERLGIVGGQSFTDLPIRTIVYPSYGVESDTPSKVLIASYSWTTDAFRLGALALRERKEVLKDLVLRNLAEAHRYADPGITYEYLYDQYDDMHVKDWNADEYTMGAFANFSPGEFESLYASLNFPAADRRLHFVGEALSTRHGWVVGALDSAWRAVLEYLRVTGQSEKEREFLRIWGENVEWTTKSTLVEDGPEHDLLDEHVALIHKAALAGLF